MMVSEDDGSDAIFFVNINNDSNKLVTVVRRGGRMCTMMPQCLGLVVASIFIVN